jgi:hypothetical protein
LYFYQLYVDGKSLVTKKLLIRNQWLKAFQ